MKDAVELKCDGRSQSLGAGDTKHSAEAQVLAGSESAGPADIAMQTRCIYCDSEQYAPFVWSISRGQAGCAWCGKVPPVMTEAQYREMLADANRR